MRILIQRLWVLLLRKRLLHARQFRANLDFIVARERLRAERDVRWCEVALARAERRVIEIRADRSIELRRTV